MPLEIALLAALVALCAGVFARWARLAASNTRIIGAPDGELREVIHGGVMCRHLVTSGTLARLEIHDWGIRIGGIAIARWLIPTWEARYDELAIAELVALPASRIGVSFRLRGADPPAMAFLSDHNPRVLRALEAHDVLINRVVTRIRKVDELNR